MPLMKLIRYECCYNDIFCLKVSAEELISFLASKPCAFVFGCSHIAFTKFSIGAIFLDISLVMVCY
jgi:hypothetical protein